MSTNTLHCLIILNKVAITYREEGDHTNYEERKLIVFFTIMMIKRITAYNAQYRWLSRHPLEAQRLCITDSTPRFS